MFYAVPANSVLGEKFGEHKVMPAFYVFPFLQVVGKTFNKEAIVTADGIICIGISAAAFSLDLEPVGQDEVANAELLAVAVMQGYECVKDLIDGGVEVVGLIDVEAAPAGNSGSGQP
jgi:hypothetical protein